MEKISDSVYYVGVNDHQIDLFEGQYKVPNGMSYNSYVIMDEKIAVMDTVDKSFTHEWLDQIHQVLGERKPDYLVVSHMEPDHSANIKNFCHTYPACKIIGNARTFQILAQFFPGFDIEDKKVVVLDGDSLSLGKHTLTFVFAPMVHWPEVMVSYESKEKILFSADAFGKFGANDHKEEWINEARRYYIGIVGKYGVQVQTLLKKAKNLDIQMICSLHGPILKENLGYYLHLYDLWSRYEAEEEGIVICYTSVYGNTKMAVEKLHDECIKHNAPKVILLDLARCDMSQALATCFMVNKIVLATTTYNADIFPFMSDFIHTLVVHNLQNKTIGFIENGSWGICAAKIMKERLMMLKNITFCSNIVTIKSALNPESQEKIGLLSEELTKEYIGQDNEKANKLDLKALFNIGYGLYVVTSNDGNKDNGLIVNTVSQVTNTPNRIQVTINKENYSHHVIKTTGKMNVNFLSTEAPFQVFENFGFQSGRTVDKFKDVKPLHSDNGLAFLPRYINSFISLEVESYVDLGTHGMFICQIVESRVLSDKPTMTYTYYQENVKPKPEQTVKGYVCKVCGYVYEGDNLPDDFICPICKHGASDFEKIE